MKRTILFLFTTTLFLLACKKEQFIPTGESCQFPTADPSGHSYSSTNVVPVNNFHKQCGLIPLNSRNFWVYEDSIYNDGVFQRVQRDTLRYVSALQSIDDGLVWWKGNYSVGLPEMMYANDSACYTIEARMFTEGIMDARKDLALFSGDSIHYLSSFDADIAAQGRSIRLHSIVNTPAGSFSDVIYFEKNARNYRKDQVYFKPGIGVLRYQMEMAPMGSRQILLQKISTLVAFHIE